MAEKRRLYIRYNNVISAPLSRRRWAEALRNRLVHRSGLPLRVPTHRSAEQGQVDPEHLRGIESGARNLADRCTNGAEARYDRGGSRLGLAVHGADRVVGPHRELVPAPGNTYTSYL